MEIQSRRVNRLQDQENIFTSSFKQNNAGKGLILRDRQNRGVLGDVGNKLPLQQSIINVGKIASTAAEFEKKATISKRSYKHVTSKVDTGLPTKATIKPVNSLVSGTTKSILRREESTASQAIRAIRNKLTAVRSDSNENINQIQIHKDETKSKDKVTRSNTIRSSRLGKQHTSSSDKESIVLKSKLSESPKLPDDIEDIDADDENSPLLLSIYIKDIYKYLRQMETKYEIREDFLKGQAVLTGKMRATLLDWLVQVHSQFSMLHETFHLTVAIIDRYFQEVKDIKKREIQLIGVSALYIASKYEEILVPDIGDFVFITDDSYTRKEIFDCERAIIKQLDFCLGRPLPVHFLRRFVKAARGQVKHHQLAKYFVDLSLLDHTMAHYKPSHLAASAICLSLFLLSRDNCLNDTWTPTMIYYSGYALKDIQPVIYKIAQVVCNQETSSLRAIKLKYREESLAKVSMLTQLRDPILKKMAAKAE